MYELLIVWFICIAISTTAINSLVITGRFNKPINNKIKEIDRMALANFTTMNITTLDELETEILLDYFKGQEAIKHLQNGYSYLATQFGITFEPVKKPRKVKTVIEQAQEVVENHDSIPDTMAHLTSGKNALGGANGHITNHIKFTPKVLAELAERFNKNWGTIPERTRLISTCPKCNGHLRTSFTYDDNELVRDEQDTSRQIRQSYTVFNCDSCGHTEKHKGCVSGQYLKEPIQETAKETVGVL
jgi:hypothetical protein